MDHVRVNVNLSSGHRAGEIVARDRLPQHELAGLAAAGSISFGVVEFREAVTATAPHLAEVPSVEGPGPSVEGPAVEPAPPVEAKDESTIHDRPRRGR